MLLVFLFSSVFSLNYSILLFQCMSFSGGNRRFVQTNIPNGYGLAVFRTFVYWVDQNLKNVSLKSAYLINRT